MRYINLHFTYLLTYLHTVNALTNRKGLIPFKEPKYNKQEFIPYTNGLRTSLSY